MNRIVETDFSSFSDKPKYILVFNYYKMVGLHLVDWVTDKKREYIVGQWKIKYKEQ